MARAEAASPSDARLLRFSRFRTFRPPRISGHARLLAGPAYQKLIAAEPLLRRLIPILIAIFLVIVGFARFIELYQLKTEREAEARQRIEMIAVLISGAFAKADHGDALSRTDVLNVLANALPAGAAAHGRRIYITDAAGNVIAAAPSDAGQSHLLLTDIIGEAQPLTTFGARAGVLEIALANDERALATVHFLDPPLGAVAVVEPLTSVFRDWRSDVSVNVAIFVGTSAVLLVILYGYFSQSSRASEADRIYSETQARFETALTRGRSGLWDWDLARGRIFWSQSMFDIVGLKPRDALLGFGEVARLIHPDDGDLMALVETLYNAGETTVDRMFRMRHSDGRWIWLRARADLVDCDTPHPHLIGIAVDVTEQMRLVERSKTADIRLRDAIETISEAFVL